MTVVPEGEAPSPTPSPTPSASESAGAQGQDVVPELVFDNTNGLDGKDGARCGPWACSGQPGQGGDDNAYWTRQPNVALPAGTYTVIDSDARSFFQNSGSKGYGMVWVYAQKQ